MLKKTAASRMKVEFLRRPRADFPSLNAINIKTSNNAIGETTVNCVCTSMRLGCNEMRLKIDAPKAGLSSWKRMTFFSQALNSVKINGTWITTIDAIDTKV